MLLELGEYAVEFEALALMTAKTTVELVVRDEGFGAKGFKYAVAVLREFKVFTHLTFYATDYGLEAALGNLDGVSDVVEIDGWRASTYRDDSGPAYGVLAGAHTEFGAGDCVRTCPSHG